MMFAKSKREVGGLNMKNKKLTKYVFCGTILSILIFFSVSFLTVLFQINSPLNRIHEYYELKIGFPFQYYHEFMVDCLIPNYGWNINNLILDCTIVWILVTGLYLIMKRNK